MYTHFLLIASLLYINQCAIFSAGPANRHARNGRLWRCMTFGRMYHTNVTTPNKTHSTLTV